MHTAVWPLILLLSIPVAQANRKESIPKRGQILTALRFCRGLPSFRCRLPGEIRPHEGLAMSTLPEAGPEADRRILARVPMWIVT